jgi:hypothetical protein
MRARQLESPGSIYLVSASKVLMIFKGFKGSRVQGFE